MLSRGSASRCSIMIVVVLMQQRVVGRKQRDREVGQSISIAIVPGDALREWLADGEHGCTIVDARPRADFARGHIPGAVSLEWEQWCGVPPRGADAVLSQPGYWGALVAAPAAWYADQMARHGITSERPIVVYADGVRSKGREGRIAWMLLYLGASDVLLLDGGWSGWVEQGGAIATDSAPPRPGQFAVSHDHDRRWTPARMARAYRDGDLPVLINTDAGRVRGALLRLPAAQRAAARRAIVPLRRSLRRTTLLHRAGYLPGALATRPAARRRDEHPWSDGESGSGDLLRSRGPGQPHRSPARGLYR